MNFQTIIESLKKVISDIVDFIPHLINGLIILIVGYLVARFIGWLLKSVLRRVKFDLLMERIGISNIVRYLGVKAPLSIIIGQTVFVLLLISFLITSTRLMGLEAVAQLLERVLLFLPNLIAALIVFLLGLIVAQYVGKLITTMGAAARLSYAARLGRILQGLIILFVIILALGVMGINTAILVTALTIMIAAFGLALGLALGLGARNIVNHILAGFYMRQRFAVGQPININQINGEVSGIGGVNTVISTPDGKTIIPNSLILESIVHSPQRQDSSGAQR